VFSRWGGAQLERHWREFARARDMWASCKIARTLPEHHVRRPSGDLSLLELGSRGVEERGYIVTLVGRYNSDESSSWSFPTFTWLTDERITLRRAMNARDIQYRSLLLRLRDDRRIMYAARDTVYWIKNMLNTPCVRARAFPRINAEILKAAYLPTRWEY